MSVIASIEIPADSFRLGEAIASNPGLTVTLERVVPLGSTFIPYLWVEDHDVDAIERSLQAETDIESLEVVDRADGEALVRAEWAEKLDPVLDAIAASDATLLEGVGTDERWRFQLRFDDHDDLTAFYRRCAEEGISVEVLGVHNPGWRDTPGSGLGLTEPQRETLRVALERGYFDVPRRVNLQDLAEELGVSDTAVSQRLRRGIETILREFLVTQSWTDRGSPRLEI